jgi:signal transduction histidine kinase
VTVRVATEGDARFVIEVADTGCGIAPDHLNRIFQYGFTTRKEGHGFGLHGSALAAQQMGGSLTPHSEGTGRGARFVLELPMRSSLPTPDTLLTLG